MILFPAIDLKDGACVRLSPFPSCPGLTRASRGECALVAAVTTHGPHRITAAIQRGNLTATQFHPEKSQEAGLRFLSAFLSGP